MRFGDKVAKSWENLMEPRRSLPSNFPYSDDDDGDEGGQACPDWEIFARILWKLKRKVTRFFFFTWTIIGQMSATSKVC
jgi:hypothetical protein